jgi:hypothetical protein
MADSRSDPPSLEGTFELRDLPAEVVAARDRQREDDERTEPVAAPRIAAVLTACKLVLADLEGFHRGVADKTDLELTGYSRAAAIWLVAGRSLGLLRTLLIEIEAGVCTEAMVCGRALHEANQILLCFCNPEEEELVRIWLEDEGKHGYVKPGAARESHARFEEQLDEAMARIGAEPLGRTKPLTEDLYDKLSRTAHNRRESCEDSVSNPGRQMAYGVHPSPVRRAGYASWAAAVTGEVLNCVGDAMRAFYGQGFFGEKIQPLIKSVEAVTESAPLDPDSIREAAYSAGS